MLRNALSLLGAAACLGACAGSAHVDRSPAGPDAGVLAESPQPDALFRQKIERLRYTPLLLPRGIEAFDVGTFFGDEDRQAIDGDIYSVCKVEAAPGSIKVGDGPSAMANSGELARGYTLTRGNVRRAGELIPLLAERSDSLEQAVIRYDDLQIRQLDRSTIEDILRSGSCRLPRAAGDSLRVIHSVLVAKFRIELRFRASSHAELGDDALSFARGDDLLRRSAENTFISEKPVALGYQATTESIPELAVPPKVTVNTPGGPRSFESARIRVLGRTIHRAERFPDGKPIIDYQMWMSFPGNMYDHVEKVTYRTDHPTFGGKLMESREKGESFFFSSKQWGCVSRFEAVITLSDGSAFTLPFNQCAVVGPDPGPSKSDPPPPWRRGANP